MITGSALWPTERRRVGEFAACLEGDRSAVGGDLEPLVALAATLRPAHFAPAPDFRAELRARLVREAAARTPLTLPRQRTVTAARTHRFARAAAAATAVTVLGGSGFAMASTRALPGDGLYPLKRGVESFELYLARSDLDRGRELLEQADTRLSEAEHMAASEQSREQETLARIDTALDEMQAAADQGAVALTDAYGDTGDPEALVLLERFVTDQRERLTDLMSLLDPRLRDDARAVVVRLDDIRSQVDELTGDATALGANTELAGARWADDIGAHRVAGMRAGSEPAPAAADVPAGEVGDGADTGGLAGGTGDAVSGVTGSLTDGAAPAKGGRLAVSSPTPTGSRLPRPGPLPPSAPLPTPPELDVPCVPVLPGSSC